MLIGVDLREGSEAPIRVDELLEQEVTPIMAENVFQVGSEDSSRLLHATGG